MYSSSGTTVKIKQQFVGTENHVHMCVYMRYPYMSEYPQCSWCVSSLSAPSNDCIAVVASCLQICLVSVTRGCWIEAPETNLAQN